MDFLHNPKCFKQFWDRVLRRPPQHAPHPVFLDLTVPASSSKHPVKPWKATCLWRQKDRGFKGLTSKYSNILGYCEQALELQHMNLGGHNSALTEGSQRRWQQNEILTVLMIACTQTERGPHSRSTSLNSLWLGDLQGNFERVAMFSYTHRHIWLEGQFSTGWELTAMIPDLTGSKYKGTGLILSE